MNFNGEQQRKLTAFLYDPLFLEKSKAFLCDYVYTSLACSFIKLTNLELDILYAYTAKKISKKKIYNLMLILNSETNFTFEFDSMFLFAKLIKDAYKYSDGIILNEDHQLKQKKLYLNFKTFPELLEPNTLEHLLFLSPYLENRKVLYISFKRKAKSVLPFKNVLLFELDEEEMKDYVTFFEWFDTMKLRLIILDFDVAIIEVGIYSNIFNNFISQNLYKVALTRGGKNVKKS